MPATVLRPAVELDPGQPFECSVQVAWATFTTGFDLAILAASCQAVECQRIAVFDVLIRNSDRKTDNWGLLNDSAVIRLFDNGNAHNPGSGFQSDHFEVCRGQSLPDEVRAALGQFVANRAASRLPEVLDPAQSDAVFARAERLLSGGTFEPPGV